MVGILDRVSRGRLALVVALAGIASVLTAASATPTMTTQALVVLTALSAAAALTGVQHTLTLPGAGHRTLRPPRRAAAVPLVLAGRTTDVVHHPVRPRAPGLV